MDKNSVELGRKLESMREAFAQAVVDQHYLRRPEIRERYDDRDPEKCREDASYHLSYLAQALTASRPALFIDYIAWTKVMLAGRNIPARELAENLKITAEVLKERLPPEDSSRACRYVEAALVDLPKMPSVLQSCIDADQPLTQLAQTYLSALVAGDRRNASRLIMDAVEDGTSIKDIYIHVFQQTQLEIGLLWQTNLITVAQEHYCTAATQMIMSQLYPRIFAGARIGRCFVGACVGGDLHEIGIRMVADFFEMEGWDTFYLGASLPGPDLIRTLQERKPDVVGISATITPHVRAVAQVISEIRSTPSCQKIKILVGGYPFHVAPDLWQQVNADGTSLDAQGVVEVANQLLQR